jgi:hypothetical protein
MKAAMQGCCVADSKYRIDAIGTKWWRNKVGELHRLDGPAVERLFGTNSWFINNKRHRLDGPASERPSGHNSWYINDKLLSQAQFESHPLVIFHRLCKEHI